MNNPLLLIAVAVLCRLFLSYLEDYSKRYERAGSYWYRSESSSLAPAEVKRRIEKDREGMLTPNQVRVLGATTSIIGLAALVKLITLAVSALFTL